MCVCTYIHLYLKIWIMYTHVFSHEDMCTYKYQHVHWYVFHTIMTFTDALPTRSCQHTATHCNALQHTATQIAMQRTATHCNTLQQNYRCLTDKTTSAHCNTLQHTATHYDAQHTATHCNTLQRNYRCQTDKTIHNKSRDRFCFLSYIDICFIQYCRR